MGFQFSLSQVIVNCPNFTCQFQGLSQAFDIGLKIEVKYFSSYSGMSKSELVLFWDDQH